MYKSNTKYQTHTVEFDYKFLTTLTHERLGDHSKHKGAAFLVETKT